MFSLIQNIIGSYFSSTLEPKYVFMLLNISYVYLLGTIIIIFEEFYHRVFIFIPGLFILESILWKNHAILSLCPVKNFHETDLVTFWLKQSHVFFIFCKWNFRLNQEMIILSFVPVLGFNLYLSIHFEHFRWTTSVQILSMICYFFIFSFIVSENDNSIIWINVNYIFSIFSMILSPGYEESRNYEGISLLIILVLNLIFQNRIGSLVLLEDLLYLLELKLKKWFIQNKFEKLCDSLYSFQDFIRIQILDLISDPEEEIKEFVDSFLKEYYPEYSKNLDSNLKKSSKKSKDDTNKNCNMDQILTLKIVTLFQSELDLILNYLISSFTGILVRYGIKSFAIVENLTSELIISEEIGSHLFDLQSIALHNLLDKPTIQTAVRFIMLKDYTSIILKENELYDNFNAFAGEFSKLGKKELEILQTICMRYFHVENNIFPVTGQADEYKQQIYKFWKTLAKNFDNSLYFSVNYMTIFLVFVRLLFYDLLLKLWKTYRYERCDKLVLSNCDKILYIFTTLI